MAELDHIVAFLGEAHSTATVKDISDVKNINLIVDASWERMLVYPGEVLSSNNNFYKSRYLVKLSEISELELMNMYHDILETITKFNKGTAFGSWVYASHATLCNIELAYTNKWFEHPKTKRWDCDIYLDIEWSTT